MKKFILFLLAFIFCSQNCFSSEEIQFIYINGSNNNDKKMTKWFFSGVDKMHPEMLNSFNSSPFIQNKFFEDNIYKISEKPEIFFWGDRSNEQIQSLNIELTFTKMFSPKLAQTVRSLLAHCLHDAIWVSHYRNMHPVISDLHKQVLDNYNKGKSVVLLGYSAGAFVTYEYMFNKLPSIDVVDYYNQTDVSSEFLRFVIDNKKKNTCIDALIDSGLAVYSADGKLVPIESPTTKNTYLELDKYTCESCIPKDTLKGVINFASPLVLFYSDISNPNYPLTYYNKLLYKYILENNMFWLTVNYADDPLGYPTTKNISYKDLKERIDIDIMPNKGFLYSKSTAKSRRTFLGAHTSYWSTAKKFSKSVVDAYIEGYILYNDNDL
ncbi:MAG: hypothetical protein IJY61_07020 [Candidatus Gastranaerophilales bacterium]|nr:hypothetical protein [Candidatus Gastranaerophilales bacterium]